MLVILMLHNLLFGLIDMDNVCRKALREIQDHIIQIRDFMKDNPRSTGFEVDMLNVALKYLVIADVDDFHAGRRSKYVVPKSNFKFIKR